MDRLNENQKKFFISKVESSITKTFRVPPNKIEKEIIKKLLGLTIIDNLIILINQIPEARSNVISCLYYNHVKPFGYEFNKYPNPSDFEVFDISKLPNLNFDKSKDEEDKYIIERLTKVKHLILYDPFKEVSNIQLPNLVNSLISDRLMRGINTVFVLSDLEPREIILPAVQQNSFKTISLRGTWGYNNSTQSENKIPNNEISKKVF